MKNVNVLGKNVQSIYENGVIYYSFKDLCNLIKIVPKERTRLGRKVKCFAKKYNTNLSIEDSKEDFNTFINKNGILLILDNLSFIEKYYYYVFIYKLISKNNIIIDLLTLKSVKIKSYLIAK